MSDDSKPMESSSTQSLSENDKPHTKKETQPQIQNSTSAEASQTATPVDASNRTELLNRARSFLASPQIQRQDLPAKRAFLREKGLNEAEIENLLHTLPVPPPSIPPRTYPQPPPSNLPIMLLGLARLLTWLAGGSAVLLLLYRQFLLPRIAQTWLARRSLKSHQLALLRQLTTSLSTAKEAQSESFSALPHTDPWKESKRFADCKTVAEIIKVVTDGEKEPDFANLPVISLLRCAIKELKNKATTEDLFRFLEGHIPWLLTEQGGQFEQQLWDTLSCCPLFKKITPSSSSSNVPSETTLQPMHWEYVTPTPATPPPLLKSLKTLSSEIPKGVDARKSPFQATLQTMSDFTGYLSTQIYLPYRSQSVGAGLPNAGSQSSLEDDLRREIRALKGLVLNRRSFMPTIPKAGLTSPPVNNT